MPRTKHSKRKAKRPMGAPCRYKPEYVEQARIATEELGATNVQLGKLFGVGGFAINSWRKKFPEFAEAVKQGRWAFDSKAVGKSLKDRAIGFEYDEVCEEGIIKGPINAEKPKWYIAKGGGRKNEKLEVGRKVRSPTRKFYRMLAP